MEMRPEIKDFAKAMELKLKKRDEDYGDSWKSCSVSFLKTKLLEEVMEALASGDMDEYVDVANVAMFLAMKDSARPRRPIVYLAGPIFGQSDFEAISWRDEAKQELTKMGYIVLNPMDRDYREQEQEDDMVKAIVEGDKKDVVEADIVLANCPIASVGTSMELFFARSIGKFIVAIAPDPKKVSPWIRYHSHRIVGSLDEALCILEGGVVP